MRVYSASKILAEEAGRQFAESFGLEFVALRFSTIYGPGKKARHGPIGVYSRIIENAMLGVPTVVEKGGDERDDLVYVRDVAQGIVRALTADRVGHWVYNMGGGGVCSLGDFAAAVRQVLGDVRIDIGGGRDPLGLGPIYGRLDITRAARDLGYAPEYDLARGIADYAESLRRLDLQPTAQESQSSWSTGGALPGEEAAQG
jgi:UDP-glucose 4-epimerase